MTPPPTAQRLLSEIDAAAERVSAAIAGVTDEQASRAAADGWSVKDQLAHLTFWHEMRFFEISRITRGGRASFPATDEQALEQINERMAANRRALPMVQLAADLEFAREMVRQAVAASPEDRLDPRLYEELGPNGAGHETAHAQIIEVWRKQEGL